MTEVELTCNNGVEVKVFLTLSNTGQALAKGKKNLHGL
jgi:hypothetical protein